MIYSDFVTRLATATLGDQAVGATLPVGFAAILPQCIDYAEQRLYRELDLSSTTTRNSTFALTAGARELDLPVGTFVTVDRISVVTPITAITPNAGLRTPLMRVSWDWLDSVYGSSASPGKPAYWAQQDAATLAVAPWPDQAYSIEITGEQRPMPLSATNTSTTLSVYFPDLFFCAAMIFLSGYMRNYGAQSDDPQQGVTWESQYKTLMASALTEEAKKRAGGS